MSILSDSSIWRLIFTSSDSNRATQSLYSSFPRVGNEDDTLRTFSRANKYLLVVLCCPLDIKRSQRRWIVKGALIHTNQ